MEDITVILNGYKRSHYLLEQINSIKSQSVKPKEIWLWVNRENSDKFDFELFRDKVDVIVDSSRNFKYHGRFSLGLLSQTKYLAYFDDDTIPGSNWFKNCLDTIDKLGKNSILGGAGCILKSSNYVNHTRAGWPVPSDNTTLVDLVGHAWFFDRIHLNNLWGRLPVSLLNGEDMQLSFESWMKNNVESYCPPHPVSDRTLWSSTKPWEYGNDSKASSNGSLMPIDNFYKERDNILSEYMKLGYTPVLMR